jgi:hypothetical protein
MKITFNQFKSLLFESAKPTGDREEYWGFLMMYFKIPQWLLEIQSSIPKDDIYLPGSEDYGIEEEPHCTIFPCFSLDIRQEDVKPYLGNVNAYAGTKTINISLFTLEDYDVLKCDLNCPQGFKENAELKRYFKCYSQFADKYQPHLTIAYLKPGMGQKYVQDNFVKELSPAFYVFSTHFGTDDPVCHKFKIGN